MQQHTISSITAYLQKVCEIRDRWNQAAHSYFVPWFRGQRSARWGLRPNIFRLNLEPSEQSIRRTFRRMGVNFALEHLPSDEWAWYFVMQHYKAPTRLLDWTDGALLALLFALSPSVAGEPDVDGDAAVWMLDPWWLNREVLGIDGIIVPDSNGAQPYLPKLDSEAALTPTLPIAIAPTYIVRRIAVQRGNFTLFGRDPDGLTQLGKKQSSHLVKFIIKASAIKRIRLDLTTSGISETTVFPDLEGLSREIVRFWTEPWEREPGVWER